MADRSFPTNFAGSGERYTLVLSFEGNLLDLKKKKKKKSEQARYFIDVSPSRALRFGATWLTWHFMAPELMLAISVICILAYFSLKVVSCSLKMALCPRFCSDSRSGWIDGMFEAFWSKRTARGLPGSPGRAPDLPPKAGYTPGRIYAFGTSKG
jgi:hypothetical protein